MKGTWRNGKRVQTGEWEWHWPSQRFYLRLDSKDRVTGLPRTMVLAGDAPEWGNWTLERKGA